MASQVIAGSAPHNPCNRACASKGQIIHYKVDLEKLVTPRTSIHDASRSSTESIWEILVSWSLELTKINDHSEGGQ